MAIIILEQDMKSGDIFLGSNYNLFAIIEEIKLESSTIPYEIKTDNTLNFVVLG